jgi:Na+/H+ antiporter NhaA
MNRLAAALIAYVVLGVLSWLTISDSRVRAVPLGILLLFAVKSILRRNETMHSEKAEEDADDSKDLADSQQLKADS